MKQNATIALFQYWDRLRDGRPAPKRTEIEPADIKTMLADTFILEQDLRGDAVFRLAGTRLCATFGRELKGFAFTSLWSQNDQHLAAKLARGALCDKTISVTTFEGVTRQSRALEFELLLLPLDGGVENPRALGCISPFEKPYWLGADPIVECRIDTVRMIDPNREPLFLGNRPAVSVPPLAPSREDTEMRPGPRRFRHLVVIDGGREE